MTDRSRPPEILLCTLNARYLHTAFSLRSMRANLGKRLRDRSAILEFTTVESAKNIVSKIIAAKPRMVGFGIYIWNLEATTKVVSLLKRVAPEVQVVLGGPEISFETESAVITRDADFVITGEGEIAFRELCSEMLDGVPPERISGHGKIIAGPLPDVATMAMPYEEYTEEDLAHRVVYVEASRGCPFKCEYCLSSLDKSVRAFPRAEFFAALDRLVARGARGFKFLDRTFNLSPSASLEILRFFHERRHLGLYAHFEMVPDRLPDELKDLLTDFPAGALQFEIGVQSLDAETLTRVSRRQDPAKVKANLEFLRERTRVHTHVDLIAGLPGEDLASFGRGFDRLNEWGADEIQIGILKRLKGTPIIRHTEEWGMVYDAFPPYEIRKSRMLSFEEVLDVTRFAEVWDRVANSGRYPAFREFMASSQAAGRGGTDATEAAAVVGSPGSVVVQDAPLFSAWLGFARWMHARLGRTDSVSQANWDRAMTEWLVQERGLDPEAATALVSSSGKSRGSRPGPGLDSNPGVDTGGSENHAPARQRRHAVAGVGPQVQFTGRSTPKST